MEGCTSPLLRNGRHVDNHEKTECLNALLEQINYIELEETLKETVDMLVHRQDKLDFIRKFIERRSAKRRAKP